jgi:hypothetical protein
MDPGLAALIGSLAALFGSLVGGAVALLGNYLQGALQSRQLLVARAAELAAAEYGHEIEITKGTPEVNDVVPLANYVAFYLALLNALRSNRECSLDLVRQLQDKFEVDPLAGVRAQQGAPAQNPAEGGGMQPTNQYEQAARRVRAIVEGKENSAWATMMETLCLVFEIPNLGERIAENMTRALSEQGLICYPNPLPQSKARAAIIMLKGSRFEQGFPRPGKIEPPGSVAPGQEA